MPQQGKHGGHIGAVHGKKNIRRRLFCSGYGIFRRKTCRLENELAGKRVTIRMQAGGSKPQKTITIADL